MEALAERVAAKVIAELRSAPVVRALVADVKQAGVMLGRTEDGVRSLVASGKLRNCSPDGRVNIAIKDIEAFVAGRG